MQRIRVALIEDDPSFSAALLKYFSLKGSIIDCVAIYGSAEEALRQIPSDPPTVVLVDINLPKLDGIGCISRLKDALPELLFLVLTSFDTHDTIFSALKSGANGYLLKRTPPAVIAASIEQVTQGGAPMSPHIARQVVSYFHRAPASSGSAMLTAREREVIELLAKGAMYKEIADQLSIGLETVRSHIKKIYDKLHAHSRTEAVLKYRGEQ
jgi:DNA-binding NarL/FixJ family response regulator